jgi:hypothetical protein
MYKSERMPRYILNAVETSHLFDSVVFHFDDFNYGRRSQPYFFLTIGIIYMCARDIEFTYLYDFSIECWNCSDSVLYIFSFYYRLWKKQSWAAIVKKKYGCDRLDRAIYLSESHDHRWAKTIDEGGPLLSMSSIKLGLLNAY